MIKLFTKKNKDIEEKIGRIKVDLSNNYKDNAVEGIRELAALLEAKKASGAIKDKDYSYYLGILDEFREDVKNFKRTY